MASATIDPEMMHLCNILVTDPATHGDSLQVSQWVTYTITSDAGSVTRRYSDFTWLSEILNITIPGCIIPSLPPKQTVGRFINEFIQARRRGLERYLYRLVEHPDLSLSEHLKSFLTADDKAFQECMRTSQSLKPKTLKLFQVSLKSKCNTYMVTGKSAELEKDAGSIAVDEMLEYIMKVDTIMNTLVASAQSLTERSRKTSQSLHDFGQGFVSYGLAEGDALGQMMSRVGAVIDQLSVTAGDHASAEMRTLLEPLGEYNRALESVKASISLRAERRQQYVQILTQIDALQLQYAKLTGVAGKETQAGQKEQAIEGEQKKADKVKGEFELITARLLRDFAVFQARKCREMKEILLGFVDLQIKYHQQSITTWEGVSPILNSTEFHEPNSWGPMPSKEEDVWRETATAPATPQPPQAPAREEGAAAEAAVSAEQAPAPVEPQFADDEVVGI